MSDVRGLPRGSKTLTIVVIVVFLQVLVVAVFGLNAITRDRDDTRRQAVERADAQARAVVDAAIRSVRQTLLGALLAAAKVHDAEDLQVMAREVPLRLVRTVYPVDTFTREVWWVDGDHRLHMPDAVRARWIAEREADERRAQMLERSTIPADLETLVRDFPFRTRDGYPVSVGRARKLLEQADLEAEEAEGASGRGRRAYARVKAAVLAALEVVSLNRERPDLSPVDREHLLGGVEQLVDAVVAGLPPDRGGDALRLEVDEFRRARSELPGLLPAVEAALPAAGPDPRVLPQAGYVLGLAPSVHEGRHVAVRLDPDGLRQLVVDAADARALADLGTELRVVAADAPVESGAIESRPVAQPGMVLPLRADLVRVRPPEIAGAGPSLFFYWVIIAGAGGGLALGGYVLVRTIRREVRIARLKADFVSNLSHELKTPLTSIAMFTEMLRDGKMSTPEDREEAYDVLTQESGRLQRIVASMIDVARREVQATPYHLQPGDVNRPVREAAARLRRIVTEPGLDLAVDLAPGPLTVRMDEAAIDDAVTNLLSNSWKYRNGDRARIEVRTRRLGRRVEIVVSDDGIGIPRRERRKVFEMFYRAEAYLNRSIPGTGLGLALVRTIVRAHKGSIRIETGERGVGTLFRIRIPLAPDAAPAVPASPAGRPTGVVEPAEEKATP